MFNFEIEVVLNNASVKELLSMLSQDDHWKTERIRCLKDWDFTKAKNYSVDDTNALQNEIENGNNILINATISKNKSCGVILYRENEKLGCSFWLNCDDSCPADAAYVNSDNEEIYYKAIDWVFLLFGKYDFLFAAIGCEMRISNFEDIFEKICDSSAIVWIIPSSVIQTVPLGYDCIERGAYTVLTKRR